MYVYIYVFIYVYLCVLILLYICMNIFVCTYIHDTYVYIFTHLYICIYAYIISLRPFIMALPVFFCFVSFSSFFFLAFFASHIHILSLTHKHKDSLSSFSFLPSLQPSLCIAPFLTRAYVFMLLRVCMCVSFMYVFLVLLHTCIHSIIWGGYD